MRRMITDTMIKLSNGAQPLVWHVTHGEEDGLRSFVGRVLAYLSHNKLHPYVVWSMASDDGEVWDCESGDYCRDIVEAEQIFANRAGTVPRRGGVTNKQGDSNG
jgi:hypothetical protein